MFDNIIENFFSFFSGNSSLLNIISSENSQDFLKLGGIASIIAGLALTAVILAVILKWRQSRKTDGFKNLAIPDFSKKLQREYSHFTRVRPADSQHEDISKIIDINPVLQAYISEHDKGEYSSPLYLFHSFSLKNGRPKADAMAELLKLGDTLYVILIKHPTSPSLRLPERFIYYKVFKEFGLEVERIVFIFTKDSSGKHYQDQFHTTLSYKTGLSLPSFNQEHITSEERSQFKSDLKKAGVWRKIRTLGDSGLSFQGPYYALYVTERLSITSGVKYWFRALNFSPLYRTGEGFWLFYAYFSQMLLGVFFVAIVAYAGQITIAGFVVISIFYFITYVLERYVLPLIRLKIAEEVNRDVVFYRRADTRISQKDSGSLWQKRLQNYDANNNLIRFFRYFAVLNIIMVFLFVLLIPEKTFLHLPLLRFFPRLTPMQYLIFFLLWWLMDNAVSIYGELYWKELATAEVITGEQAVKTGLSRYSNLVEGVSDFFTFVVSTAGFLLGFGIATLNIEMLMAMLLIIGSAVSIASGFILPMAMPAFNYFLILHAESFFDNGKDNEIIISPGLKMILNPLNPRLRHVVPVDYSDGKTWLPAVEDLCPVLLYNEKPEIALKGNRVIISGKGTPLITLNRTHGFFSIKDLVSINQNVHQDGAMNYAVHLMLFNQPGGLPEPQG
ncbi:MAG: hypothetical protein AB1650_08035 [Candidatus Omnitrophota bacterium]